jgi:hypothetical protein
VSLIQEVSGGIKDFPRERRTVCSVTGAARLASADAKPSRFGRYRSKHHGHAAHHLTGFDDRCHSALTETVAAFHIFSPSTQRQGKRKHVSAIVIFTKQFHQFSGWGLAV